MVGVLDVGVLDSGGDGGWGYWTVEVLDGRGAGWQL